MSITEILEVLPKLSTEDRNLLHDRLYELEADEVEETPEMLAFIDEGIRSIREDKHHTIEEARELITQWTTKSS